MKKDLKKFVTAVEGLISMFDFNQPKPPPRQNIWQKKANKTEFPDINALKK
jgi:hypothetical protein